MEGLEPKKLALLRILQIFEKYSDQDHPLKQEDIADHLFSDYGIDIERKAISRNISLLKEAGIEIESSRAGSYLDSRDFTESELRVLI
ncbi:MAG: WYL domain-containing protein, partial [Clostridia bacterium]|nr:WYL domain-containing protein [Clostridia bacterium]